MSIETITILLYAWLFISIPFPLIAIIILRKYSRLKNNLLKLNLTNRYYEEMLYASKDGYITHSVYKNKVYQFCSRRLATILNLKNGEDSTTSEVFAQFISQDSKDLSFYFDKLLKTGTSFEIISKSKNNKTFLITGIKINSSDSKIDSTCIWFRDITKTTEFIDNATSEALSCREQIENYRILIDNIPYPIWLRNDKLDITLLNRQYLKLLGLKDFKEVTSQNSVLHDLGNTTDLVELAKKAKLSNTIQKKQINLLNNGDLVKYEITEAPHHDSSLKTTHIIGSLIDITNFDEAKRNYQVHLDSHLDILSSLDTAFCIINTKHNFTFGNIAFLKLWNLPENFLDSTPHYNLFLDTIREKKTLPEVSDFKAYKEEENKAFDTITEQKEDLLYIPDGRTFRRIRAPHPDGTLIAYEDITDNLATSRKLSDLLTLQQIILDNLSDSVVIFSPNLKLKLYNNAFIKLTGLSKEELKENMTLKELMNLQKTLLPETSDWNLFLDDMIKQITSCQPFNLKLKNKQKFIVTPLILPDTSLMITYRKD